MALDPLADRFAEQSVDVFVASAPIRHEEHRLLQAADTQHQVDFQQVRTPTRSERAYRHVTCRAKGSTRS